MRKYVEIILLTTVVVFGSIIGGEAIQQPYGDMSRQDVVDVEPLTIVDAAVEVIAENDVLAVGQLARLQASGDKADWSCVPDSAQAYGEGNLSYCISFREPGEYTVVAAILAGENVHVVKYVLQVEGPVTVVVPDEPPPVDPPVVDPIMADPALVQKVQAAAVKARANKTRTADVGEVFAKVAEEIRDGSLKQGGEITNRTALLNRELNLSGLGQLMGSLQTIILQAEENGRLDDAEGYLVVWLSIAEGLGKYAT
jgi:hypothetical protein